MTLLASSSLSAFGENLSVTMIKHDLVNLLGVLKVEPVRVTRLDAEQSAAVHQHRQKIYKTLLRRAREARNK